MTINPLKITFFDVFFNSETIPMIVSKVDDFVSGMSLITVYAGSATIDTIIGCDSFYMTVHDNDFTPDRYFEAGYSEAKLELLRIIFSAIHEIYYESTDSITD